MGESQVSCKREIGEVRGDVMTEVMVSEWCEVGILLSSEDGERTNEQGIQTASPSKERMVSYNFRCKITLLNHFGLGESQWKFDITTTEN